MEAKNKPTNKVYLTLTSKQKEVLDLLIDHKTSKEMARELDISPHTVDQRVNSSKRKLDAASRGELATTYRELKTIYEETVYQTSDIEEPAIPLDNNGQDETANYTLHTPPEPSEYRDAGEMEADYRVVPEMFEGRFGKAARIVAMLCSAFLLVVLGIAGLAMFSEISELLAH